MATNEAEFKTEFKRDLIKAHPGAHVWTSTDLLRSGLPDFYILHQRLFMAVEAKFIKTLPKKQTSLVLSHSVSGAQQQFLKNVQANGCPGLVLIGSPEVAVVMTDIKENYTLAELMTAPRFEKLKGQWQVKGFFNGWRE